MLIFPGDPTFYRHPVGYDSSETVMWESLVLSNVRAVANSRGFQL
jgi:hypothetical protein